MASIGPAFVAMALATFPAYAQTTARAEFKLALPDHKGQLRWSADGFKIVQTSAKPNGHEIGIRGQDASARLTFLGFLFLFPEQAPLTSAKCRDGVLDPEKKSNPTLEVLQSSEIVRPGGLPISLVSYTTRAKDGATSYMVRGFVATGDACGDLEFYSSKPLSAEDAVLKTIFSSYLFDESHTPTSSEVFVYAQALFQAQMFKAAAPIFEIALARLADDGAPWPSVKTAKRVITDQAGISYGISGEIDKARAIFGKAITEDPDYPMYYYNLACADAEEKKLGDARLHLQAAFARKANMITDEPVPDPTKDDSFLPYQKNKDFWTFLQNLQATR
jgi:tetratricopeptide (TPR) repeat protein